ncbi:tRNA epoxyqueuosine(34) reductase QueG [Marinicella sp. S1101]|uniref:tRNA epoxyqueuosine(34) reductase QueG n=1 Tax=Marinicella marina TaxID=2996016 RepID=UPI002260DA0A|nr:tRNA epoxyqueuosine(34) reductase QueG [Marinicella marina]MCX7555130.1 tRNA epoxyqueuosine(34) reductase QueG [Marinicella marina]MDJ1140339.1 tRNA epoxyqueuosine(34) reductase QueG [Marinicella marina]
MQQNLDYSKLKKQIKNWAIKLGFQQAGISDINLSEAGQHLNDWLKKQYHGDMSYMARHGEKRYRPEALVPDTLSIISVRLDYMPAGLKPYEKLTEQHNKAAISRYALGRDYHKVIRNKLKKLAQKITAEIGEFGHRVFTDSAPVMEKAIAEKAGLGWIGKHSNLLNSKTGSYFFLGEIYTDLPLEPDSKQSFHCGSCTQCIQDCPTDAIVAPFQVDAKRCISYLTIENKGPIPLEFRAAMGNRIYGCDDCQVVCPWNKFTHNTKEQDFQPRHQLDDIELLELFNWSETEFLSKTEGSPIRRIGYEAWQRNLAVGLGNAEATDEIIQALEDKLDSASDLVKEHIEWALDRLVD